MPALIGLMLAYMFWALSVRLPRERVAEARSRIRLQLDEARDHGVPHLLRRAFRVEATRPDWEQDLVTRLRRAPVDERRPRG